MLYTALPAVGAVSARGSAAAQSGLQCKRYRSYVPSFTLSGRRADQLGCQRHTPVFTQLRWPAAGLRCRQMPVSAAGPDADPPQQQRRGQPQHHQPLLQALQPPLQPQQHKPTYQRRAWWQNSTLSPLLRNAELWRRLGITVLLIMLLRVGHFIPLPDVPRALIEAITALQTPDAMEMMFKGIRHLPANIYQVGYGPLLTVSLVLGLLSANAAKAEFKMFEHWQEQGAEGQAKYERLLQACSVLVAFLVGLREARRYAPFVAVQHSFVVHSAVQLAAGTAVMLGLGQAVKAHGIGEGMQLMISLGVASGYTTLVAAAVAAMRASGVAVWVYPACAAVQVGLIAAAVHLTRLELPEELVHYRAQRSQRAAEAEEAGRLAGDGAALTGMAVADSLPLRICNGGMMSLVFAPIVMSLGGEWANTAAMAAWSRGHHAAYCVLLAGTVFTLEICGGVFGDTPKALAKCLVNLDAGIRGLQPGAETEAYLAQRGAQLRALGGAGMAALAVTAQLFDAWCLRICGITLATFSVLLMASLLSSLHPRMKTLWQKQQLQDLVRRESEALQAFG